MAHFRVAIAFRMATSSCTAQALVDRHATALLRRRSMAQQRSGARHELRPIRLCVVWTNLWKVAGPHGLSSAPFTRHLPAPRCQLTILHALELQPVGVEEEHGVIIVIILASRVDDLSPELLQEAVKLVDVAAAAHLEGIVVEADVADAGLVLPALRIGLANPEARLPVRPADRVLVFVEHLEAQEL